MKAVEALALIDELTEIAMLDTQATNATRPERQKAFRRAREICKKLEAAPGPLGLVREKVSSLCASVEGLFEGPDWMQLEAIFADLASLHVIVERAVENGSP